MVSNLFLSQWQLVHHEDFLILAPSLIEPLQRDDWETYLERHWKMMMAVVKPTYIKAINVSS